MQTEPSRSAARRFDRKAMDSFALLSHERAAQVGCVLAAYVVERVADLGLFLHLHPGPDGTCAASGRA